MNNAAMSAAVSAKTLFRMVRVVAFMEDLDAEIDGYSSIYRHRDAGNVTPWCKKIRISNK
ncbi:MAG TPA: hypothetical protein PLT75_10430 [Spirochaetota bacterium]|nr:hypothetical protein [Spirochaetota bacterium]